MFKFSTKKLMRASIVGGLYVVLSLITFPVSSGAIQFRIAEGLTLLPLIFPETCFGVFVGCIISNFITGCPIYDVIIGSIITLVAGILTAVIGKMIKNTPLKIFVGGLFPVLLNAFLLPLVWLYLGGGIEYIYTVSVLFLLLGQSVSVYLFGSISVLSLKAYKDKGVGFLQ